MNDVKIIELSNGSITVVDSDLHEWLSQWKWKLSDNGYAFRYERIGGTQLKIYLHSVVNQTPTGLKTDHKNGIKLDNRRSNLRSATSFQQAQNCRKHLRGQTHSRFKGVWKVNTGKWVSQITAGKKKIHVGTFPSEQEAAAAFNVAALEHHGEFARLNVLG